MNTENKRDIGLNLIKISDIEIPELEAFRIRSEVQLLRYFEPAPGIFLGESPKVIERAIKGGYEPMAFLVEDTQLEKEETLKVLENFPETPIYYAEFQVLTGLTGYQLTRGMICALRRKNLPRLEEICEEGVRRIAVLENVVNPTNVGAIFRSAAALHMDAVILTAGCSDPYYRRAARVSMGTVFQIPWTMVDMTGAQVVGELSKLGFAAAAMALEEDSVDVDDEALAKEEKLAVVLGTEGEGLAQETIDACDYTVCIPMSHGVDSLNVAAASAVAFYVLGKMKN